MSDLRPKHTEIELGGKKYGLLFDLNAIDEIQDRFKVPITELDKLLADEFQRYKVLKVLLAALINEAIEDSESGDPHVTEEFIGRKINVSNIDMLTSSIFASFVNGTPERDGEDDPTTSG